MSKHKSGNLTRASTVGDLTRIEIKSKLDAEFRRYSMEKLRCKTCQEFYEFICSMHRMSNVAISIFYTDPSHGDLLPINNDDNFLRAISTAKPLLRLFIQREGSGLPDGNLNKSKKNILRSMAPAATARPRPLISIPQDFRRVSAIVDVDIIPETHRRVKLLKHNSDKPLGFYIRDGTSVRVTQNGVERVPGIFISRLVPGGLAESTGLLAVNDEILEVNGIEVAGKTLDQVTDMMIANSENLIITVKPAIQLPPGPSWKKETNRTIQRSGMISTSSMPSLPTTNSIATNGEAITLASFTNVGFDDLAESDDDQPSIDENGVLSI